MTGHASHQMGLDADIWLRMGSMSDTDALNSDGKGLLVVNRKAQRVDESVWTANHAKLIKLAAEDPKVTRIFVNPAIKLKLCETAGSDRAWLHKIRPWFGHDSHFHVRLTCPQGAQHCENQAPVRPEMAAIANFILGLNRQNPGQHQVSPKLHRQNLFCVNSS